MSIAQYIQAECCGTTCDKQGLIKQVEELERTLAEHKETIAENEEIIIALVDGAALQESELRETFINGVVAGRCNSDTNCEKLWLTYSALGK